MNVFEITLDVDKRSNKESVNLRQGDINGTTIRATLRDHDVPLEGGDYTGAFCMTLPDRKTYYWNEADYADGVVSVVVDERIAASVPGSTNNAYFELYDGEELKYTTASFMVRIKPAASEVGAAAESYDLRVETIMDEMRTLMEEDAEAEQGRVDAELARVDAEDAREAAESARAAAFAEAEEERQAEFESAESERASSAAAAEANRADAFDDAELLRQTTFETNETSRRSDYESDSNAWTLAEEQRASTFTTNESARQATFVANEQHRQEVFDSFASPTVSVEETSTGQIAHITWKDSSGTHVSDMSIDDAISAVMTGDVLSVPVDPNGTCVADGTANFYFSGWVGDRMAPCSAVITTAADSRFTVRITNATAREQGLVRIDFAEGTTYPPETTVCTLSLRCGGRTFLHRISAVAPRGGVAIDGVSPTVAIDDTETGHTVTITDASGDHTYTVPTYASEEASRASAESSRVNAETARATAETARVSAESARASAEIQRESVVEGISDKIDSLTTRGAYVSAEYVYRETNDGVAFTGKSAAIGSIHGRTVVWNQLVNGTDALTRDGITTSYDSSTHLFSVQNNSRTTNYSSGSYREIVVQQSDVIVGHTYIAFGNAPDGVVVKNGGVIASASGSIFVATTSAALWMYITSSYDFVTKHPVGDVATFYLNVVDLTRMFGSGNEPSTVAEFEQMFPDAYYPYDAGSLLSVNMTGIETVGKNLLDASTETAGKFINQNGGESSSSDWKHSDFIQVVPGQTYTFTPNSQSGNSAKGAWYTSDSNSSFVSSFPSGPQTVVAPNNARYVRVSYRAISENVQFEIGAVSTEYEPYWSQTRTIPAATYFPGGMRSAGSVYDELTATSAITRIGERAYQSGDESDASVVTDGTVTHYALATPTTTTIDPPLNLTYKAASGGTERITHTNLTAPPTMEVTYSTSIVDNMLLLPEDYISRKSFQSFCDALSQAANLTITEVWNETKQQYDYTIVSGA